MAGIQIQGPADLAWVYKKGSDYTVGLNLSRHSTCGLHGPGDYGIATFRLDGDKKFASAGHVYLRYTGPGKRIVVPCYLLKSAGSRWYDGKRVETGVTVTGGGIEDVTAEYEAVAKAAIDASMDYVEETCESNEAMVRMFSNGHNHYTDLGFARFAQRRDGHHSIVTSGCAGIPELGAHKLGAKTWDESCKLAALMSGFDRAVFDGLPEEKRLNVLDELACLALAGTGFMYQWNLEKFDSICLPAVVFGTMQDCEDNAVAVVAAFNWLVEHGTAKTELGAMLLDHLRRMCKMMRMVAGYVDVEIANPEAVDPNSISGHAWAVMYLNDEYRPENSTRIHIIEGTDPFYVQPSTGDHDRDAARAADIYGGALGITYTEYARCTYDSPKLQERHRYKTVDVEFGPSTANFVGRSGGGRFRVGLTIDQFVEGGFDRHPTADPETVSRVQERWGNFALSPSIPAASRLFDSFPELVGLYKLAPSDYKPMDGHKGSMSAVSAYDIKTKIDGARGYIRGTVIEYPFAHVLVVAGKPTMVSR